MKNACKGSVGLPLAVQIVGSMSASGGGTGLGRHQLSTRFTSVLRVVSISQPDKVRKTMRDETYFYPNNLY